MLRSRQMPRRARPPGAGTVCRGISPAPPHLLKTLSLTMPKPRPTRPQRCRKMLLRKKIRMPNRLAR